MCIWIPLILLKTENNKKNNKKVTVWVLVIVHMPDCTIHVSWTMQWVLVLKKKKKKKKKAENANVGDVDAQTKQTLDLRNLT